MTISRRNLLLLGTGAILGGAGLVAAGRYLIDRIADRAVSIITPDAYRENLFELYSSARRAGLQTIVAAGLRPHVPRMLLRPSGGPNAVPPPSSLMLNP